jgi:hypothetical protein
LAAAAFEMEGGGSVMEGTAPAAFVEAAWTVRYGYPLAYIATRLE